MAPIIASIDIRRPAEEVFAYLDELERHGEWQTRITSAKIDTPGPVRVGTRVIEMRQMPGGAKQMVIYEIVQHEPPRTSSFRGIAGPIRPVGTITIDALDEESARVRLELDFEGHGIGKLLVPLVLRMARKQVPLDQARLKARLEGVTTPR